MLRPLLLLIGYLLTIETTSAAQPPAKLLTYETRLQASQLSETSLSRPVRVKAEWQAGEFIFNGPRGRSFLASAGRRRAERSAKLTDSQISGLSSQTISGQLFRLRRRSRSTRLRTADRLRHGSFAISQVDESTIVGNFQTPNGFSYSLVGPVGGPLTLAERRSDTLPTCGETAPVVSTSGSGLSGEIDASAIPRIRVLFVYSSSALAQAGSLSNLAGYVNLAVGYTHEAWNNSGVNGEIEIAGLEPVGAPNETGNYNTDLSRITDFDGVWDGVHTLRNQLGADVVSLMLASGQYCGLGWISPADPDYLFHAFKYDCTLAFRHELGHNLGSMHDREHAAGAPIFPWGYGWRFVGNSSQQFITLMSYAPGTAIDYASSPSVLYDGQPTGVVNWADNVRVWNSTLSIAAAARGSPSTNPTPFPPGTPTPALPLTMRLARNRPRVTVFEVALTSGGAPVSGAEIDLGRAIGRSRYELISRKVTDIYGKTRFRVRKTNALQHYAAFTADQVSNRIRVRKRR